MPRGRHGYFHVVNNEYIRWAEYTMGGSASPTINSQGNRFVAPDAERLKKVTKRDVSDNVDTSGWNWRTKGDVMENGAYFNASGKQGESTYSKASSVIVMPFSTSLTQNAGTPHCNQRNCN
ncbi:unnamed protein product [Cuscuta europaea]|uniref:Pectate lyase n=1 Tax=Cuscuta europaea TaxID=41803 RepID=A0A9P0Z3N6_CUSEU|nr:unnamed protein product [Cuscuta europaea]